MKLWVTCLAFACVATLASAELFSSMAHLETALYAERDIAVAIQDYIHEEEKRLDKLKKIASDFADHSEAALAGDKNLLANPINAYLYMKRFTLDWDKEVAPNFQSDPESAVHKKIEELKGYLPNYDDLRGAVTALLRLQDTYQLDTNQLAQGRIRSMMAKQMSASDCFEIGKMTYNNDDYYHTTLWMEKAMNLVALEKNRTVQRMDILDYLAFSLYKQGNVERALVLTNELLALLPHHTRAQNNRKYYEKLLEEQRRKQYRRGEDGGEEEDKTEEPNKYTERPLDEYRKSDEFQTYESLCRGEDTHDYKLKHKLKCRYVHKNNPRLLLKPAKEEEVYLNPWIVIYHDVVSDKEIDTIKRIATPLLSRATVHNPRTGKLETAEYRVSKSAWLKDGDDPVIHNVNNRISDITGLSMATAEELQIANYGLGGQYEPHFDFARRREPSAFEIKSGNRIATFLTYMTNVDAGGATVFTHIGVKLFPIKGAAAFWYNLYRSGDGIFDTRHAACPVLVGQKWVSNKWIHERGQEFRRPCSVNMDE